MKFTNSYFRITIVVICYLITANPNYSLAKEVNKQQQLEGEFRFCSNRPKNKWITIYFLKPDQFRSIIRTIPELSKVHRNPSLYTDSDIMKVILRGGTSNTTLKYYNFTWCPLKWEVERDKFLVVIAGYSGDIAFITVLQPKGGGSWGHVSSYFLLGQTKPIALLFGDQKGELYWTECWQCKGTGGKIEYVDGGVIIHQNW